MISVVLPPCGPEKQVTHFGDSWVLQGLDVTCTLLFVLGLSRSMLGLQLGSDTGYT